MPSRATGASFRRAVAFQWFFTAFSVRPGMAAAMSAQRFPSRVCASTSASSSASVHAPRLMSGRTWLFHRSRHCFPVRRPRPRATSLHLRHPCVWTSAVSAASSASVQPCRARSRSLGDVSLKENAFPRGSGETGVTDGARPPGTLVRVAPPLRCANASRSASIASSSMSANDPDPCGRLRMGKGRRSGQGRGDRPFVFSDFRFLRFLADATCRDTGCAVMKGKRNVGGDATARERGGRKRGWATHQLRPPSSCATMSSRLGMCMSAREKSPRSRVACGTEGTNA